MPFWWFENVKNIPGIRIVQTEFYILTLSVMIIWKTLDPINFINFKNVYYPYAEFLMVMLIVQFLILFPHQFLKWQIISVRFSSNYLTYKNVHFKREELKKH